MNDVLALHKRAMELSDQADSAKRRGDLESARAFYEESLRCEERAASSIRPEKDSEPSRSILFRSAASLAVECHRWADAERMVALGLSGYPPDEIAGELRDLMEQIHFARHLEKQGVTLEPDEDPGVGG